MGSYKIRNKDMTLEEAKKVYKKNYCSLFVMSREDADNYMKYKKLNIDSATEEKWRMEVIKDLVNSLEENGDSCIFNQLYDLSVCFHDKERLKLMIEQIDNVKIENVKTSLCMAETIMGRKVLAIRSGMIFWAYDIGQREWAIFLIRKVLSFLNVTTDNIEDKSRIIRDQKKIREIIDLLGIEHV